MKLTSCALAKGPISNSILNETSKVNALYAKAYRYNWVLISMVSETTLVT